MIVYFMIQKEILNIHIRSVQKVKSVVKLKQPPNKNINRSYKTPFNFSKLF